MKFDRNAELRGGEDILLMGRLSMSIKFAIALSLSFTVSSSSLPLSLKPTSLSSPPRKATASDVLTLLGPKHNASAVDPCQADELRSCFRFLVPFNPAPFASDQVTRRSMACQRRTTAEKEDELVWWPPPSVLELARLAFDSGGDPDSIYRTLDPTVLPVPDAEGSEENHCELTRTPYGRRFISQEINSYFAFLFEIIASHGPSVGLDVSLNRYDLFHGHIFIAKESGRLGILFHAKEYPAYEKEVFPYNMGYCQRGSNVAFDDMMNLRNILWLAPLPSNTSKHWETPGVLVILDAHPGGIVYRDLIPEYVQFARTLYEDDFGDVVADVNYLNVGVSKPDYFQIFIC